MLDLNRYDFYSRVGVLTSYYCLFICPVLPSSDLHSLSPWKVIRIRCSVRESRICCINYTCMRLNVTSLSSRKTRIQYLVQFYPVRIQHLIHSTTRIKFLSDSWPNANFDSCVTTVTAISPSRGISFGRPNEHRDVLCPIPKQIS